MNTEKYSADDLHRYLRKGFAFAPIGGEVIPIHIHRISETYTNESPDKAIRMAQVSRPNSRGNSNSWDMESLIDVKLDEIDITPIPSGIYNYRDRVMLVSRRAEVQWNMVVNSTSYSCYSCNPELPSIRNPAINTPKTLEAIHSNKYYSVDIAIKRIRGGKRFMSAISNKFWLSVDRYSDNILIGCSRSNIVGIIKPDDTAVVFKGYEFLMESLTKIMPIGGVE